MPSAANSERQLVEVEQKLQKPFQRARQASMITYQVCYPAPSCYLYLLFDDFCWENVSRMQTLHNLMLPGVFDFLTRTFFKIQLGYHVIA